MATPLPEMAVISTINKGWNILQQRLAPGRLSETDHNVEVLTTWCKPRYDLKNPQNTAEQVANTLMLAVEAIYFDNILDWDKHPSAHFVSEIQRKHTEAHRAAQIKKEQKAAEENSEAAFWERQKAAEAAKKAEVNAKKADVLKQAIHSTIMTVEESGSRPNTIDHAKSEKTRERLFNFVTHRRQQRVSDEVILSELKEVRWADDIKRELERRWDKVPTAKKEKEQRDSLGGDVRRVGALGSLI